MGKISGLFRKGAGKQTSQTNLYAAYSDQDLLSENNGGRKTVHISNINEKGGKVTLADFTILDSLGSGSFGTVYAVVKNSEIKEAKKKGIPQKVYAMKFLEKHNVLQ